MKFITLLFLSFSSLLVYSQHKHLTSFGFKGGLNRSIINGHEPNGTKTGYVGVELYAGFFAETEINDRWRFENEMLYSFTDECHFIEVPLHVKYVLFRRMMVFFGPKIDLIVNKDNEIYEFNNFGVSVEPGLQYNITAQILAEIRYSIGLMKQINDFALDIYDGKRNTIRIGLGFRF